MKRPTLATIAGITLAFTFAVAHAAHAATLTIVPPDAAGQVVVLLDTQGQAVNAVEAHLKFDPSIFAIIGVNDGGSVINFWVAPPAFSNVNGTVDLAGIVPGGVTTGKGVVITILIAPKIVGGTGLFIFASSSALLNDGKGTPAPLTAIAAPFSLAAIVQPTSSAATSSSVVDTQAPDPFIPQVARDPALFNGAYFVVFAATDQRSGIDHYEILEVPAGTKSGELSGWAAATSPYMLKDQTLSSDIYIRAVDGAGNFRVVTIPAGEVQKVAEGNGWVRAFPWISGIIILLLIGVFFTWRTRRSS